MGFDPTTGKPLIEDMATGEVYEGTTITVPLGTTIRTPAQQRAYEEWKKREQERREREEREKWRRKESVTFFFVREEYSKKELRPATKARLIYLATYLGYDGVLALSQRMHMQFKDLQSVLALSQTEVYNFWNEVKGTYIAKDKQNNLLMVGECFKRGKLDNKHIQYKKLFTKAVRQLYRCTEPTKHKYLGYVFQMLPFVNVEYNILCHNPTEKDLDYIIPLSVNEFCTTIGYRVESRARLLKTYTKVRFPVGEREEQFCSFVTDGTGIGEAKMFINPHILYMGSNAQKVEVLGAFVK